MKNDHRSKFSNWNEEAWKNQGFNGIRTSDLRPQILVRCCTICAMKPHIRSKVSLLSLYLPSGVSKLQIQRKILCVPTSPGSCFPVSHVPTSPSPTSPCPCIFTSHVPRPTSRSPLVLASKSHVPVLLLVTAHVKLPGNLQEWLAGLFLDSAWSTTQRILD